MLRVGYSANLAAEWLSDFPQGIELIRLPRDLDHDVEIDVWLPDPYPTRNQAIVPHLRGVKLVLSLMAGTEWIPAAMGPHVTICNARGAHNISTAEWTLSAILAMLKHFPLFLDIQRSGEWKRRSEASAEYAEITGDSRAALSAGDAGGADREDGSAGRIWLDWQRDRAHARTVPREPDSGCTDGTGKSEGACGGRTGCIAAEGPGCGADSAFVTARRDG